MRLQWNTQLHLSGDERDEDDEEHISEEESDDDDEDIPYNPKNLPLGWDGKVSASCATQKLMTQQNLRRGGTGLQREHVLTTQVFMCPVSGQFAGWILSGPFLSRRSIWFDWAQRFLVSNFTNLALTKQNVPKPQPNFDSQRYGQVVNFSTLDQNYCQVRKKYGSWSMPDEKSALAFVNDCSLFQPIPYWLYKLHGLNISYTCEICGNFTYRGPKAFQRHFAVSAQKILPQKSIFK